MSDQTPAHEISAASARKVSVVIPTYNMAWCLDRAIRSCIVQSMRPQEIIVVDDGSSDSTAEVAKRASRDHPHVAYIRLQHNSGHLAALKRGIQAASSDWIALLDADDELLQDSLKWRVDAAKQFFLNTGEWPALVYGDLIRKQPGGESRKQRFPNIQGRATSYLFRELSLCQTSTIMVGSNSVGDLAAVDNPYNTDDEIVLAVGKRFPLLHCGRVVTIAHDHDSPTRMTVNADRRLAGIFQLVRRHHGDIRRHHGVRMLMLWYLRILRVALESQIDSVCISEASARSPQGWGKAYCRMLQTAHRKLSHYLRGKFDHVHF